MNDSNLKIMSYADAQSVKILVGDEMGFDVACTDTAKRQLEGWPVPLPLLARLDREATSVHNRIAENMELINTGTAIATRIARSYGFHW